jgi:hypothetical protein
VTDHQLRRNLYLVLALIGLVGTAYFNRQWLNGPFDHTVKGFIEGGFANSASSSFGVDLTVSFLAASLFIVAEGRRLGMRHTWAYIAGSLVTAIAFTFPLFLYVREKHLAERAAT